MRHHDRVVSVSGSNTAPETIDHQSRERGQRRAQQAYRHNGTDDQQDSTFVSGHVTSPPPRFPSRADDDERKAR